MPNTILNHKTSYTEESVGTFEPSISGYDGIEFNASLNITKAQWKSKNPVLNSLDVVISEPPHQKNWNFFRVAFCKDTKSIEVHVAFGDYLNNTNPVSEQTLIFKNGLSLDPKKAPADTCSPATDCASFIFIVYNYDPSQENLKDDLYYRECNSGRLHQIPVYKKQRLDEDNDTIETFQTIDPQPDTKKGQIIIGG